MDLLMAPTAVNGPLASLPLTLVATNANPTPLYTVGFDVSTVAMDFVGDLMNLPAAPKPIFITPLYV